MGRAVLLALQRDSHLARRQETTLIIIGVWWGSKASRRLTPISGMGREPAEDTA